MDLMNLNKKCKESERILLDNANINQEGFGWVNHPLTISEDLIAEIENKAELLSKKASTLVVIGVGGSYLGTKAISESLLSKYNREREIVYLGNSLSEDLVETLNYLKNKDFVVNYISKSGTTLEPALAYEEVLSLLKEKYKDYKERIVVTTGEGPLKNHAIEEGIYTFDVPHTVGGRYSVFTAVGLLPLSFCKLNIKKLISGAKKATDSLNSGSSWATSHAIERINANFLLGKDVEILAYYEPKLRYLGEWWKQLYAESEGKEGKGIFPATACYTRELHSIGQFVQEGKKMIFETQITFKKNSAYKIEVPQNNFANLSFLDGFDIQTINDIALNGTEKAHLDGGVPVITLEFDELNEFTLGEVMQTFMISCALSSLMMDVNPFNQPGVEEYKKNVKSLLQDAKNNQTKNEEIDKMSKMEEPKKIIMDGLGNIYVLQEEKTQKNNKENTSLLGNEFSLKTALEERIRAKRMLELESVRKEKRSVEEEITKLMENLFGVSVSFENVNNGDKFEESITCMTPSLKEQESRESVSEEKEKGCPFIKAERERCGCDKCDCALSEFYPKEYEEEVLVDPKDVDLTKEELLSLFGAKNPITPKETEPSRDPLKDFLELLFNAILEGDTKETEDEEYCNCKSCNEQEESQFLNAILNAKSQNEEINNLKLKLKGIGQGFNAEEITEEEVNLILEYFDVTKIEKLLSFGSEVKVIEFNLDGESYTIMASV